MPSIRAILSRELPLKVFTPEIWAVQALSNIPELLSDHAHLEKKAANNAMMLLHRRPELSHTSRDVAVQWVNELNQIARDEVAHLELVCNFLHDRGGVLSKNHENYYAQGLRAFERKGSDPGDLIDRLFVSALIEARSCERFFLLAEAAPEEGLRKLYSGLWSSEHGHYKAFISLACSVLPEAQVMQRWEEMLELEGEMIQTLPPGCRIHSWVSQ